MGLSFTCQLFEELSTVVHWVCENKSGLCGRLVYQLHDFWCLPRRICIRDLNKIMFMFNDIAIPIKETTTDFTCNLLMFGGIELDSILMVKRLPPEKLAKARHVIQIHRFN